MALREHPQAEGQWTRHPRHEKSQSQGNEGLGYLVGFHGPPQPPSPARRERAHSGYGCSWGVAANLVPTGCREKHAGLAVHSASLFQPSSAS